MNSHPTRISICVLWIALVLLASTTMAAAPVSLAGKWRFALDPQNQGIAQQWFHKDLSDSITLPGILQTQNYGDAISTDTPWILSLYDHLWYLRSDYKAYTQPGHVKVPFLSQPPRHYLGAAWYQRDITVPTDWQGQRIVLTLERPHWETTIWIDDRQVGVNNSLCAPHVYDLGVLTPGSHRLSVRIDNHLLLPYRPDAHSVSDSEGGAWNGIVGAITLSMTPPVWIDDAQVYPSVAQKAARIDVKIGNMTGQAGQGTLSVGNVTIPVTWDSAGGTAQINVPLGTDAQTWDEFHPILQHLTLHLTGGGAGDQRDLTFGLREITTKGTQILLNGRPTHIRMTHDGGDFPLTGAPATDVASWKRIMQICQSYGLNGMRFHSWCPPDAAFTAADELGFFLQPECGMWNSISPGSVNEKQLYAETDRILKAYGNHPSFIMLSASNEPSGGYTVSLPKWVSAYKGHETRRLFTEKTGWDVSLANDTSQYLVQPHIGGNQLRGDQAWFGGDWRAAMDGVTAPVLVHEMGQWCAYPDYSIIPKFTGYMQAGNFEIFRDSLAAHGLIAKDKDFAYASGRYQLECYKEEIEANLRTPNVSGFQLLDLHDYVGQGTALVGLLDTFWDSKGYTTPAEFREFCSATVPLAVMPRRVYTAADTFDVPVQIAHDGAAPLVNAVAAWQIVNHAGTVVAQGKWPAKTIPIGKNTPLGNVTTDLTKLAAPGAYKLVVSVLNTPAKNEWNFWLYPAQQSAAAPNDVLITHSWDDAQARLAAGGKVLFLPNQADIDWNSPPLDKVPIFWDRQMGPKWSRMLGIWCDTKHPALAEFPTDVNYDWQWTSVISPARAPAARALNLDRLPAGLQPIVQPIDDWNRNYKLGLVFECRVGTGRLMVCAADIDTALDTRPAARQLRRSLLDYMAGAGFQPKTAVSAEALGTLLFDTSIMHKLNAAVTADGQPADALVDGDPNTTWQSAGGTAYPHVINVAFPAPVSVSGLAIMPQQNEMHHNGDIRQYTVQISDDGTLWRDLASGELPSTFDPQRVSFPKTINTRYLRLTALSGYPSWDSRSLSSIPSSTAALGDLAVVYAGPKLPDTGTGVIDYQRVQTATPEIDEGTTAPKH